MPVKQKVKRAYHKGHHKEKHSKHFVKVYAPYLPLLLIVGLGIFISFTSNFKPLRNHVLSYATNMSDDGLLDATNKERTDRGLKSLTYNSTLDKAAQAKANDMAARDYWSHNTPDGKEPWYFVEQANYHYYKAAENLAYGFDTSNAAVVGWMNSPSHRANVLDGELRDVGFGIVNVPSYQGKGPETIVVALYGVPSKALLAGKQLPIANPTVASTALPKVQKKISYAQTFTGGSAPWITFAIGLLIGLIFMYLAQKHTRNLHRAMKQGQRFALHHPLLDATLIALLALAAVVAQTAGTIY